MSENPVLFGVKDAKLSVGLEAWKFCLEKAFDFVEN